MAYIMDGEIYAPEIKDVRCKPRDDDIFLQGGKIYTRKEIEEMKQKKLGIIVPANVVDEVVTEIMDTSPSDIIERRYPFTRFEKPDGVDIVSGVGRDNLHMICCTSLETSKKLRTEIIRSLELLNYYIDQIEKDGYIRYVR